MRFYLKRKCREARFEWGRLYSFAQVPPLNASGIGIDWYADENSYMLHVQFVFLIAGISWRRGN